MGLDGVGVVRLLIVLGIVIVIFGAKRVKTLGGDLGASIKNFRTAMRNDEKVGGNNTKSEEKPPIAHEWEDAKFSEETARTHQEK